MGKAVSDASQNRGDYSKQSTEELDAALELQKTSTLLIQEGSVDVLYEKVLDAAVKIMSADFGSLQVYSPERNELRLLAHRGFHPLSAAFWEIVHVGSTCTCGIAMSSGARIVLSDLEAPGSITTGGDLKAYRKSGIRAVQSTPLISRSGQLLGMISTHWRKPHSFPENALRPLDVLARQAADLIERGRIEVALRDSEERSRRLASIVESSDDAIISKNLEGIITSWNKGAERIFGYTAEEVIGKPITILIPADRHNEEPMILERIRRGEPIDHYETVRRRKDGSLRDISITVSPLRNLEGKIVGASKIARDITDRKRAEALVANLAKEAEHRTKNVLSIVLAAIHLSKADSSDELKRAIEGRIQALANVHTLFVDSRWAGADVHTIAVQELAPYCRDGDGRALIEGPNFLVKTDAAQAIAVTLHELATNAAKYGALSIAEGRIRVEWSRMPDDRLILRWVEENGPGVESPAHQGFGTRVMQSMITALDSRIEFAWNPQGLLCEIIMPA
jgi:PAS domain S-box-containing protein